LSTTLLEHYLIERFNNTLRQRVSRLVRKILSFSKSLENHIGAIWYFIHHYNASLQLEHYQRWNNFAEIEYDQDDFLDWIEASVIILRHHLQSVKTVAGKKGSVTGFTGAIELGLTPSALTEPEYVQLFWALGQLAPYCGTGHKTTLLSKFYISKNSSQDESLSLEFFRKNAGVGRG
jgi:hypothetical protein